MAVADVFDAQISRRVCKPPMGFEVARDTMVSQRGKRFDTDLLDRFVVGFDEFCTIARRHPDEATDDAPSPSWQREGQGRMAAMKEPARTRRRARRAGARLRRHGSWAGTRCQP